MLSKWFVGILVVTLVLVTVRFQDCAAQTLYGSILGNVTDSTGATAPGASVEAANLATNQTRRTITDDRGSYQFSDLWPGTYDVTVSLPGFTTFTKKSVSVTINTTVRVDVALQVAGLAESTTVEAAAAMLQTDRADLSAQLTSKQVTELPLPGLRNYQSLLTLVPGAAPPRPNNSLFANPQQSLVTNVNGTTFSTNNTRLDGASNYHVWLPHHVAMIPPAEAIETVNIVTNSFEAEQGLAGGAVINVNLKSGANDFHGSLFEHHTNSALRARNVFFIGDRAPSNILNQYGFTLGGPIRKNKLFFFGDYEGTRRRETVSNFTTVPTAELRAGDFSRTGTRIFDPLTGNPDGSGRAEFSGGLIPAERISPVAQRVLSFVPLPNQPGLANNLFVSAPLVFDRDQGDIKINYNHSDNTSLFGRYSITEVTAVDPPILGQGGGRSVDFGGNVGTGGGRVQSVTVGGTRIFSPRFLMDAHVGFTRQRLSATNTDFGKNIGLEVLRIPGTNGPDIRQSGFPRFSLGSAWEPYGNQYTSNPFFHRDNQWQYGINFSLTRGAHSLRWGIDLSRQQMNHWQPEVGDYGPRGGFTFSNGVTALRGDPVAANQFNAFASFLLGLPQNFGKSKQEIVPMSTRLWAQGYYLSDRWQMTRNLTLTLGLRYEYYPFPTRDHRGLERYDVETNQALIGGIGSVPRNTGVEVSKTLLAPRLGLAYRLGPKWVLRAGYGISIDPYPLARPLRDNYPTVTNRQFQGGNSFQPAGRLEDGLPPDPLFNLGTGIIPIPADVTTNTVDKKFRRGYVESFNLTVQRELPGRFSAQASYVGTRGIRQMNFININAAPAGTGTAGRPLNQRFGRTADTRVVTPFRTADYNALQLKLDRRFVAGLQVGVAYTFSKAIAYTDNSDGTLFFNHPSQFDRNRALTGYDRTHNLQANTLLELPLGQGKRWATQGLAARLLGGWQLNALFSRYSGTPFTVTTSGTSLNAPGNSQTADQVAGTVRILGRAGRGASYFDPFAFVPVTGTRFGTSGRNILRGPGVANLDASLFRNFRLSERFLLQLRVEAFNVSNTPHFDNPGADVSRMTLNRDGTIRDLGGYTEITTAQRDERQIRLGLRFSF